MRFSDGGLEARLVYNYLDSNYDIGERRKVMKAIINGLWKNDSR